MDWALEKPAEMPSRTIAAVYVLKIVLFAVKSVQTRLGDQHEEQAQLHA